MDGRSDCGQQRGDEAERFALVVEGALDGLWDWDLAAGSIYISARWKHMLGYEDHEIGDRVDEWIARVHPDDLERARETLNAYLDGRSATCEIEHRLRHRDGSWRWILARGASRRGPDGRPVRMAGSYTDITDRKRAEELLREREAQYRGIFDHASDGLIVTDRETGVVLAANAAVCRMHGCSKAEFVGLHRLQFIHPDDHPRTAEYVRSISEGQTPWIRATDVRKDGTTFPVEVHGTTFTWMGKPAILGVVRDMSEQQRMWETLEQRVAERTHDLSTLLDISRTITATLDLPALLQLVCEQMQRVIEANSVSIVLKDGDDGVLAASVRAPDTVGRRFPAHLIDAVWPGRHSHETVTTGDVRGDDPIAVGYRVIVGGLLDTHYDYVTSWLGVPMLVQERVVGVLSLSHHERDFFTPHHAGIAATIANQAAVAIENARLHEQARVLAALEERQRLARELHDSVSQAIYGIALGARTARAIIERDPLKAIEPLEYVLSLAEAGLAEMRALIFELRPESLEQEGLVAALEKHAAAVRARHGLVVEVAFGVEPTLPLPAKEALYRIAQEALHNVVKHSGAARVDLRFEHADGRLCLEIRDDGRGFDTSEQFPGHLGLRSMAERAASIGATLSITSRLGAGTTLRVDLPVYPAG